MSCAEEFRCIFCDKTLDELREFPGHVPKTHTAFKQKGDKHELCHPCWTNNRKKYRNRPKTKEQFQCIHCKRTNAELQELSKQKQYYAYRRRLPGDSRKEAAKYCGACYYKLRRLTPEQRKELEPDMS